MAMLHLAGLWSDGWFYLSAGGFLASLILFVYFLGNYRTAVEAEDEEIAFEPEAAQAAHESAPQNATEIAPQNQDSRGPSAIVADAVVQAPLGAPSPDVREIDSRLEKLEHHLTERLTALESDLNALKSSVDSETAQGKIIFKRLDEISALKEAFEVAAKKSEEVSAKLANFSQDFAAAKKEMKVEKETKTEKEPKAEKEAKEDIASAIAAAIPIPVSSPSTSRVETVKSVEKTEPAGTVKTEPLKVESVSAIKTEPTQSETAVVPEQEPVQAQSSKPQSTRKTPVWPI